VIDWWLIAWYPLDTWVTDWGEETHPTVGFEAWPEPINSMHSDLLLFTSPHDASWALLQCTICIYYCTLGRGNRKQVTLNGLYTAPFEHHGPRFLQIAALIVTKESLIIDYSHSEVTN
jgi:hypothetical protein